MYKIVDLFAGAGGLSLGFEMTGEFEVVAFVENNRNATKTYQHNHPGITNYNDIIELDFNDILREYQVVDVVIGGPPCQGFSNANRQRRKLINGSNELVKRYVEAIKVIQPKVFVMENVKTIASDKHSFCLTRKDSDHIIKNLGLNINNKEVILYENKTYSENLMKIIKENEYLSLLLINDEQLYFLKTLTKNRDKLNKFFAKNSNLRAIEQISNCIEYTDQLPAWFENIISDAKQSLLEVCEMELISDENMIKIMEFWDIQRLLIGIKELNDKEAIYEIKNTDSEIIIVMKTYIVIDYIEKSFEYLGYSINGGVLNAAAFGAPQCRERYILLGVKMDSIEDKNIELPKPIIKDSLNYLTVKEAISDLEKYQPSIGSMDETIYRKCNPKIKSFYAELVMKNGGKYIYNHVCTDSREIAKKRFAEIKQGDNFHSLPDGMKETYENPERTQNTIYKRLDYTKPSDTVVNVRKSMWIHPQFDRAVSAREAARLQSFPDNYVFLGTKDSVYQQIGNAVPPILGRVVAEKVLELLNYDGEIITLKDLYTKYCK